MNFRRRIVCLLLLLAVPPLLPSVPDAMRLAAQTGQNTPAAPQDFRVQQLAANLFMLQNGRSRSFVFVIPNDIVLVDTNRPGRGPALKQTVASVTNRPVTTIVNTHSHSGHTSGNLQFPGARDIIAHVNASSQMRRSNAFSDGRGLPNRTFTDQLSIGDGADRMELYYFGRAHTNGDVWVFFPAARVLYTDVFIGKEMPIIDGVNGGSGLEYPATIGRALAVFKNRVDRVITGHGEPLATMAELADFQDYCREFIDAVQAGKRAGRSVQQVADNWMPSAKYSAYTPAGKNLITANIEVIFAETK